jgi:hypothetical protein
MAQIIKHRRGTVAQLSSYGSLQRGELAVTTGSVFTTPITHIGGGSNNYVIGRLQRGTSVPNVGSINGLYNDILFHDTDDYILYRLHSSGNENLDLTGNIKNREIGGNVSGSATSTGSFGYLNVVGDATIAGNLTFGDANTDYVSFGADVSSSLIPNNDDAFDLGSSGQQWKDLYINGTANIDSLSADTAAIGDLTSGRVVIAGTSGELQDDGDLTFSTDTLTATKIGAFEAAGAIDFSDENMTNVDIDSGAIDGTAIGASSHTTIKGTTIDATTDFTIDGLVLTADTITNDAALTVVSTGLTLNASLDIALSADGGNVTMDDGTTTIFDFNTDDPEIKIHDDAQVANYASIAVGANGATTFTTVDTDAAAANLLFTVDGTVDIDSAGLMTLDSGGAINLEPAGGSAVLIDGNASFDGDQLTGLASVTSTAFLGTLDGVVGGNTPAAITGTTIDATTDFTIGSTVITDDSIVMTPTAGDTATISATTNGVLNITTVDTAAAAANITITADGTFEAIGTTVTLDSGGNIALEPAGGSHIKLDDVIQVDSGVITGATSITSTAFVGTIDGVIGGNTPAAITGTTITANTGVVPDANDGAYLGQAGTAFSDLFLAEGGVINWDSGDATLTQASDVVTLAGATLTATLTNSLSKTANGGIGMTTYNGSAAVADLALDIDGMTDIGAAPASGDLIIIDDGANGTNRKSTIDRVATKFAGTGLTATSAVIAIDAADTTTTSIINASLTKIGTNASQEYVTFGSANEVNTHINNTERLSVTATGVDVTGVLAVSSDLTVTGNYTVNGTTTFISSSTLEIGDNIIQVNSVSPVRYGGIQVKDVNATETGSLVWDSTNDYWLAGQSGSEYRVPVQATTGDLTDNKLVIGGSSGRIESSANITDNGTTVDFNDVDLTSLDKLEGVDANTYVDIGGSGLIVTKGTIQPATNGGNDLGATGTRYANLWLSVNADVDGDLDVDGTTNLDVTDIDGTLDVAGVADFQSVVDAQASLTVTGSVYVSAGASVAATSASLVSFRNNSNTQLGYLASADTQAETTGIVGYNTSNGNLTISSVIDGGSF